MRQRLRLNVLLPVAVLGLLGAGFGAFAMGGPDVPESLPVTHPTSSDAVDTGVADTGAVDTAPTTPTAPPPPAHRPRRRRRLRRLLRSRSRSRRPRSRRSSSTIGWSSLSFHTPGADLDGEALREARAGAVASHAGFLAVDVTKETAVAEIAAEYEVLGSPTILVVVKGGEARSRFEGYVDRQTVAQAVTNAGK